MIQTSRKVTFLLSVVFAIRINDKNDNFSKMIIFNGNKIHDLDYDVIRHSIHLKVIQHCITEADRPKFVYIRHAMCN